MSNVKNIIDNLGGVQALSTQHDIPIQTVYSWIRRGNIPAWWRKIIGA